MGKNETGSKYLLTMQVLLILIVEELSRYLL